jgi:hypothetical protein
MFHPPTRRAITCESQGIGRKGWKRKEEAFLLPVTNSLVNRWLQQKQEMELRKISKRTPANMKHEH